MQCCTRLLFAWLLCACGQPVGVCTPWKPKTTPPPVQNPQGAPALQACTLGPMRVINLSILVPTVSRQCLLQPPVTQRHLRQQSTQPNAPALQ
jgi:hypothetical protein